ncbi:hypothetical protein [Streptomyces collinus]|uniref:hypothetical protein n=1 Tax=Streptomyces collinus TaxID=42684 RepID=UPI0036CC7E3E
MTRVEGEAISTTRTTSWASILAGSGGGVRVGDDDIGDQHPVRDDHVHRLEDLQGLPGAVGGSLQQGGQAP